MDFLGRMDLQRFRTIWIGASVGAAVLLMSMGLSGQEVGKGEATPNASLPAAVGKTNVLSAPANAPAVSAPDVRVEYFGAERGYAVGMDSVLLLCVVRNAGSASL